MQETSDSFGIVQLPGKRGEKLGEKRKCTKASVSELEDWCQWESLFSFS